MLKNPFRDRACFSVLLVVAIAGCEFRIGPPAPTTRGRVGTPTRSRSLMTEKWGWNGKSISIVIENVRVSRRGRRSGNGELHLEFDDDTVTVTESQVTVNGTKREFVEFSAVDIYIGPQGLNVKIDGKPFSENGERGEST